MSVKSSDSNQARKVSNMQLVQRTEFVAVKGREKKGTGTNRNVQLPSWAAQNNLPRGNY